MGGEEIHRKKFRDPTEEKEAEILKDPFFQEAKRLGGVIRVEDKSSGSQPKESSKNSD